ncbi:MAG: SDR family oxidoreductase [Rhizobiales bacterium]|nr:SDR family oxidoreductase [Hyphomicrobiales bacterium]
MTANLFDLTGKTAIVTGSSRGIGRAIALGLAGAGANVAGSARSAGGAEKTAQEIRGAGGKAIGVSGDMTNPGDVAALVGRTVDAFGQLDIMHANAGIDITQPVNDFSPEEFTKVIEGNLNSTFLCAQAAAKRFIKQGTGGSIIFTSSNASVAAFVNLTPYCASKGGIDALVRAMSAEYGPHGIRVNAINPGYTNHQMNPGSETIMDDSRSAIIERTPLRRIGDVAEMAGPSIFLASDAASYVTGVCMMVDGGWCAT